MAGTTAVARDVERLQLKALAYLALARLCGSARSWGDADAGPERLAQTLEELGWNEAAAHARRAAALSADDPGALRLDHSRIFDRSVPPPYETSYTSGGSVAEVADVAGFYRAFGVAIQGDKPDHAAAELEYLSFMLVKEAHAAAKGDNERAGLCASARAQFVRHHAGGWLSMFAERICEASGESACYHLVRAAAASVAADARELGVQPDVNPLRTTGAAAFGGVMPGPRVDLDEPPCAVEDDSP